MNNAKTVQPRISIMIVVSDNLELAEQSIHSLIVAKDKKFPSEIIIVDRSLEPYARLKKLATDFPDYIQYFSVVPADNLNTYAFSNYARGDYILVLNAGDKFDQASLDIGIAFLDNYAGISLIYYLSTSLQAAGNPAETQQLIETVDLESEWKAAPLRATGCLIRKKELLAQSIMKKLTRVGDFEILSVLLQSNSTIGVSKTGAYQAIDVNRDKDAEPDEVVRATSEWMDPLIKRNLNKSFQLPNILQYYLACAASEYAQSRIAIERGGLTARTKAISKLSEIALNVSPEFFFAVPFMGASQKIALLHVLEDQDFANLFSSKKSRLSFDGIKTKLPKLKLFHFHPHETHFILEGFAFLPPGGHFTPVVNGFPGEWEEAPELTQNIPVFGKCGGVYRGFRLFVPRDDDTLKISFSFKAGELVCPYALNMSRSVTQAVQKAGWAVNGEHLVKDSEKQIPAPQVKTA